MVLADENSSGRLEAEAKARARARAARARVRARARDACGAEGEREGELGPDALTQHARVECATRGTRLSSVMDQSRGHSRSLWQ